MGSIDLSESVFGVTWNPDLVHQVVLAYQANMRAGSAHTKDRSEVSGGGKKPWKQKGTGRARHGSSRSPIWVGGGITHGPRNERDWSQKINYKMRLGALATLLSRKLHDGQILSIGESFSATKTRDAQLFLMSLSAVDGFKTLMTKSNPNNILVIGEGMSDSVRRALRNIPCVSVVSATRVNPLQVAQSRYIILMDAKATDSILSARLTRRTK